MVKISKKHHIRKIEFSFGKSVGGFYRDSLLRRAMHGFTIPMSSTEQIWCDTCRGFKRQALYTRHENLWFCVVSRTRTTSETPMGYVNYLFLFYHIMNFIVLPAAIGTLPFYLLKGSFPLIANANSQARSECFQML